MKRILSNLFNMWVMIFGAISLVLLYFTFRLIWADRTFFASIVFFIALFFMWATYNTFQGNMAADATNSYLEEGNTGYELVDQIRRGCNIGQFINSQEFYERGVKFVALDTKKSFALILTRDCLYEGIYGSYDMPKNTVKHIKFTRGAEYVITEKHRVNEAEMAKAGVMMGGLAVGAMNYADAKAANANGGMSHSRRTNNHYMRFKVKGEGKDIRCVIIRKDYFEKFAGRLVCHPDNIGKYYNVYQVERVPGKKLCDDVAKILNETLQYAAENDLEIVVNPVNTDQVEHTAPANQPQASTATQLPQENRAVVPSENTISYLWNHGAENAWREALDHYYNSLKDDEQAIDSYMENISSEEIAQLPVDAFYAFLHDKYFVWKYTAKNRLATTRRYLERYVNENKLSELADIQKRLFSADRSDIEKCLRIASEIRGLGPAGASGLLSVLFPESFGTIDQYVVKALNEVEQFPYAAELAKMNPDSLSIKNGVLLIRILREQASSLNAKFDTDFWTPRKIDMVLWVVGRDRK